MAMELSTLDEAGRADLTKRVSEMQRRHALAVMTLTTQEERLAYIKGIPTDVSYSYIAAATAQHLFWCPFFCLFVVFCVFLFFLCGMLVSDARGVLPYRARREVLSCAKHIPRLGTSSRHCRGLWKTWRASADVAKNDGLSSAPRPGRWCQWPFTPPPTAEPIRLRVL